MGWLGAAGSAMVGNKAMAAIGNVNSTVTGAVNGVKDFFRNTYQDTAVKGVSAINSYSGDALKHDFAEKNAERAKEQAQPEFDISNKVQTQEKPENQQATNFGANEAKLPGQDDDGSNARGERARHFAKFFQNQK